MLKVVNADVQDNKDNKVVKNPKDNAVGDKKVVKNAKHAKDRYS